MWLERREVSTGTRSREERGIFWMGCWWMCCLVGVGRGYVDMVCSLFN